MKLQRLGLTELTSSGHKFLDTIKSEDSLVVHDGVGDGVKSNVWSMDEGSRWLLDNISKLEDEGVNKKEEMDLETV